MIKKLLARLVGRKDSPKSTTPAQGHVVTARPNLRVIGRDQHDISRKHISAPALKVLYKLRDAGFEAHLVGGAVRDLLLGQIPKDFDIATNATPEQVRGLFRNCRLIGRRFRLAHVMFGSEIIEVATFRGVADDGSGDRHVVDGLIVRDNVYGTIEEDAMRRDFTVNAMYYSVDDFAVRDFAGGFEDLQARQMRLIGDAESRYREDPVRMLRAVRLAAKLNFDIEGDTAAQIFKLGDLLDDASPARLFDELLKLLMSGHGRASFEMLQKYDLLRHLLPLTAQALERAPEERALLIAALDGTDARIAEDKPVTPAFLIAALFWPAAEVEARRQINDGVDSTMAWVRASHGVIDAQSPRIALPKRFTVPMQEIWALQSRMEQIQRKRVVFRVLTHPRFRAAFDFLEMRAAVNPAVAELAAWWREAQSVPHDELSKRIHAAPSIKSSVGKTGSTATSPKKAAKPKSDASRVSKAKSTELAVEKPTELASEDFELNSDGTASAPAPVRKKRRRRRSKRKPSDAPSA